MFPKRFISSINRWSSNINLHSFFEGKLLTISSGYNFEIMTYELNDISILAENHLFDITEFGGKILSVLFIVLEILVI